MYVWIIFIFHWFLWSYSGPSYQAAHKPNLIGWSNLKGLSAHLSGWGRRHDSWRLGKEKKKTPQWENSSLRKSLMWIRIRRLLTLSSGMGERSLLAVWSCWRHQQIYLSGLHWALKCDRDKSVALPPPHSPASPLFHPGRWCTWVHR